MKYKDAIIESMKMLSRNEKTRFLGYNVRFGSQGYGTLKEVPDEMKIETPLAENLMVGLAIGMSLEGYHPVIFFERHDFILNALDGIVNHLDKIERMSDNQFKTPVIIRAIIGGSEPIDPGAQHTQDFTKAFEEIIKFPIYSPRNSKEILEDYERAYNLVCDLGSPVMIIEKKDIYEVE
jgi:pyruvate/2-oxoglutarate/acetoin dehydrogenase E1 component